MFIKSLLGVNYSKCLSQVVCVQGAYIEFF